MSSEREVLMVSDECDGGVHSRCENDDCDCECHTPVPSAVGREPDARDEALAAIEKAFDVVGELCNGTRRWTMSVPARPHDDPDLVIADALGKAKKFIGAPVVETPSVPDATQQDAEAMNRLHVLLAKLETAAWWDGRMDRSASADHIAAREAIVAHVRTLSVREPDAPKLRGVTGYAADVLKHAIALEDETVEAACRVLEDHDMLEEAERLRRRAGVRNNLGVNDGAR